jgi:D-Tyr-tRNAtyr deacylase
MVVFVAFLKDAQLDDVNKLGMKNKRKLFLIFFKNLAKEIATVKLCESDDGMKTIVDVSGDLLIIPQATLGGRLNGHRFQYHHNINKDTGLEFYDKFVSNLRELCSPNVVHAGSYGIRQIYSCETNGPAMHLIEF